MYYDLNCKVILVSKLDFAKSLFGLKWLIPFDDLISRFWSIFATKPNILVILVVVMKSIWFKIWILNYSNRWFIFIQTISQLRIPHSFLSAASFSIILNLPTWTDPNMKLAMFRSSRTTKVGQFQLYPLGITSWNIFFIMK